MHFWKEGEYPKRKMMLQIRKLLLLVQEFRVWLLDIFLKREGKLLYSITQPSCPVFVFSYQVKILEASDRVGGRIQTYRSNEEGWLAELGPMRIPTVHYFTRQLAKDFNLNLVKFQTREHSQVIYWSFINDIFNCSLLIDFILYERAIIFQEKV